MFNFIKAKSDANKLLTQQVLKEIDDDLSDRLLSDDESSEEKREIKTIVSTDKRLPVLDEKKAAERRMLLDKLAAFTNLGINDPRELVIGCGLPVDMVYSYLENKCHRIIRKDITPRDLERLSLCYTQKVHNEGYDIKCFCQTYAVPYDLCTATILSMDIGDILNPRFPFLLNDIILKALKLYNENRPKFIDEYNMDGMELDEEMDFVEEFVFTHHINI